MSLNLIQYGPQDCEISLPQESMGATIFHKCQAVIDQERTILVDSKTETNLNYKQLKELIIKLNVSMRNLGLKKDDTVAIISENNYKYVAALIASWTVGAKVNLLNPNYIANEYRHFFELCKPNFIWCSTKSLSNLKSLLEEYEINYTVFDGDAEVRNFEDLIEGSNLDDFKIEDVDLNSTAVILTSSGTSGLPKLVEIAHKNLLHCMTVVGDTRVMGLNSSDVFLEFLPYFHVFGTLLLLGPLIYETKGVILDKFQPDIFLRLLQDHRVTKLFTVPPILLFLIQSPMVAKYNLKSIIEIYCGAAPVPLTLCEAAYEKFNVRLRLIYGLTEVAGPVIISPPNNQNYASIGKVCVLCTAKISDINDGRTLGPNETGEICIKWDANMIGYYKNPEETANNFDQDHYVKTGDLGYYDENGYFYMVDRIKEIIKYKGFQVAPAELENILLKHPAVKDAGVIGIPDERTGEKPMAFIVKQANVDVNENDLIEYVKYNVSTDKRLYGGVRFVDQIPKTPTGKILRRKLKELL